MLFSCNLIGRCFDFGETEKSNEFTSFLSLFLLWQECSLQMSYVIPLFLREHFGCGLRFFHFTYLCSERLVTQGYFLFTVELLFLRNQELLVLRNREGFFHKLLLKKEYKIAYLVIGRKNDCTFWSNRSFLVKYFVHNRGCKDFPFNPQISKYTTRKRVEVGNYPRAFANFAKNIRPRKPYLRRALSVQQSA